MHSKSLVTATHYDLICGKEKVIIVINRIIGFIYILGPLSSHSLTHSAILLLENISLFSFLY